MARITHQGVELSHGLGVDSRIRARPKDLRYRVQQFLITGNDAPGSADESKDQLDNRAGLV